VPLLEGTRVLACETGLAGPLCSRLLADLGADVVKIERPGEGDVTRGWDSLAGGLSSGFVWMNRGKRSVALDVKDDAARPALEALVARSDVFLHNFAPGWAERVALDEPAVRALRPDIVYTEISGYGPDGPYAERNAYDLVMQGETGLISVTGTPEDPARVGVSICDVGAGSYAAVATLAALVRRGATGEGTRVSVSLFDVMVDWLGYFPYYWWQRGEAPDRTGMRHPLFCPYGPYPAQGGRLFGLAVLSPDHWRSLCTDVLGRADLLDDDRYASNESRVAHRAALEPLLEAEFATADASEWLERLRAVGIPCGDVNDVGDVMRHPQLEHNRLIAQVDSPVGSIPVIGNPFLLGGTRPVARAVPALGEHTDAVITELGLDGPDV
jgi:crotonobetainyl-CoA:carnitine CoA-transferase CaiB-like acyl-CoA transferase